MILTALREIHSYQMCYPPFGRATEVLFSCSDSIDTTMLLLSYRSSIICNEKSCTHSLTQKELRPLLLQPEISRRSGGSGSTERHARERGGLPPSDAACEQASERNSFKG
jgi:hypothetical protein